MKILPTRECAAEMADYIVENHHAYIKKTLPHLLGEIYKVAIHHGDEFPFMKRVFILLSQVKSELELNMKKEEEIIFPFLTGSDINYVRDEKFLSSWISQVGDEHEFTVDLMGKIRKITHNYEIPAEYGIAMQLIIASLKSFECNLLVHFELENNFLFEKLNARSLGMKQSA